MQEVNNINELAIVLQNHIDNEEIRHNSFDKKLDGITIRLDYTNGSIKDLTVWRAYMIGGLAVLSAIVIPLLIYVWEKR